MFNDKDGRDLQNDEPFDNWLRSRRPPEQDFSQEMEEFLDGFRETMHADVKARKLRQRRFVKGLVVVIALVIVCVVAWNLTDLIW